MEALDLLARFVIGGAALVFGSEWLASYSKLAERFFISRGWLVLRYVVAAAVVLVCVMVLRYDWS
jgi:hypothetical protein